MKTNAGSAPSGHRPENHDIDFVSRLKLRDDEDWKELRKQFNTELSLSSGLALLHRVFRAPHDQNTDLPEMINVMLTLADRYYDDSDQPSRFGNARHYSIYRGGLTAYEIRKRFRLKAFMVLCESFFKAVCSGDEQEEAGNMRLSVPRRILFRSDVFEKLIWFFRPHKTGNINSNIMPIGTIGLGKDGGKHYLDLAQKFAREFCTWSWDFAQSIQYCEHSYSDEDFTRILTMCESNRLEIFDLMCRLQGADLFISEQYLPSPQSCEALVKRYLAASRYTNLLTAYRDGDDRAGILLLMEHRVR